MTRCRTCVMPDTRPDTQFVDGVCSACISHANQERVDWEARQAALLRVLDECGGRVLVASSGGKDSTYIALRLKELGADVTAVTATTCMLTELGRRNLDNLARHVRTIEVTPNMTVRAKLNRLGLQMVGDISWPEHVSIFTVPFRVALETGIRTIFYGENPQAAYGGPPGADQAQQLTARWRSEFGGFLGLRPSDLVGKEGITERDMLDYALPADLREVKAYFLGHFEAWDSHRNVEVAERNGFVYYRPNSPWPPQPSVANWWPFENLDCALTGIHDFFMYRKYSYGRGCAQISVDVRNGLVSRAAALDWVQRHDGLFEEAYAGVPLEAVLGRIGMTKEELMVTADRFTNWKLFPTDASA